MSTGSTVSTVYNIGGGSAYPAITIDKKYAYISNSDDETDGNVAYVSTVKVDDPTNTHLKIIKTDYYDIIPQMAVDESYMYMLAFNMINHTSVIKQFSVDDTNNSATLHTKYEFTTTIFYGIAVKDNYIYVSHGLYLSSIDKVTGVATTVASGSDAMYQLAINGDYLYAASEKGVARFGIVDGTFIQRWWSGAHTFGIAADGDYVYAQDKGTSNIRQISVADPTNYSWFDQTVKVTSLYATNGNVYAPLTSSTVMFTPFVTTVYNIGGGSLYPAITIGEKYAYISNSDDNVAYISTVKVDDPTITHKKWIITDNMYDIIPQMAVDESYMYMIVINMVNHTSVIKKVSVDDTNNPPTLYTVYETKTIFYGIAVKDNYIYVSYGIYLSSIDKVTGVATTVASGSDTMYQIAINGNYLYAASEKGVARFGIVDGTFIQRWWSGAHIYGIAADGDYVYAQDYGTSNILQISVADPTNYSWFDQTVEVTTLYATNGCVYAPLTSSTVMFTPSTVMFTPVVTLTYRMRQLNRSVVQTETSPLRKAYHARADLRNSRGAIVGYIEFFNRVAIHKGLNTFNTDASITLHLSTLAVKFSYTSTNFTLPSTVKSVASAFSGMYTSPPLITIKPERNVHRVTISPRTR